MSRRPARIAAAAVLATAALAVAAALALGGSSARGGAPSGPLGWQAGAIAFAAKGMPGDRIATGRLRNASGSVLELDARHDVRVVDAGGRPLRSAAVFSQTFGHALFDPTRRPIGRMPEFERARVGRLGRFAPGAVLPVTISWHETGAAKAARIEYRGGSVEIPPQP